MAAGLGFKTFNTGDVLTAADTNGYLMQGVLVFADAAARTAAITSPQEGQTSYLKDTDVIQVYSGSAWVTKSGSSPLTTKGDLFTYSTTDTRLPVGGTNGHVLQVDSSTATGLKWGAAPSSSSNYTLINSGGTALTGATNIYVSGFSGYSAIIIRVLNAESTNASSSIKVTINDATGGASAPASSFYVTDASPNTIDIDMSTGGYWLTNYSAMGSSSTNRVDGIIQINNANSTGIKPYIYSMVASNSTGGISSIGNGYITNANAITSVLINSTTGNFDGGTIYVYGAS